MYNIVCFTGYDYILHNNYFFLNITNVSRIFSHCNFSIFLFFSNSFFVAVHTIMFFFFFYTNIYFYKINLSSTRSFSTPGYGIQHRVFLRIEHEDLCEEF